MGVFSNLQGTATPCTMWALEVSQLPMACIGMIWPRPIRVVTGICGLSCTTGAAVISKTLKVASLQVGPPLGSGLELDHHLGLQNARVAAKVAVRGKRQQ